MKTKKIIALLLTTTMAASCWGVTSVTASAIPQVMTYASSDVSASTVAGFVERLYVTALGRNSEAAGKSYWITELNNKNKNGAEVAWTFFLGEEATGLHLSNNDYITRLYSTFMNRTPDSEGFSYWNTKLTSGEMTREDVFYGFVYAPEWVSICNNLDIYPNTDAQKTAGIEGFATRLYTTCLGRAADEAGLQSWISALSSGANGSDVAYGFFFSDEFKGYNLSNTEYVTRLYETFMDREPDSTGSSYWIDGLTSGSMTKTDVFNGFISSAEWQSICSKYGINCDARTYYEDDGLNHNHVPGTASETPTTWQASNYNLDDFAEYYASIGVTHQDIVQPYHIDGVDGVVYAYFQDTDELFDMVNDLRVANGREPLLQGNQEIANIRAVESAYLGVSHDRPNGGDSFELCELENTTNAWTNEDIYNAYYESADHRYTELNRIMTHMSTATAVLCRWVPDASNPNGGWWCGYANANVECFWGDNAWQQAYG